MRIIYCHINIYTYSRTRTRVNIYLHGFPIIYVFGIKGDTCFIQTLSDNKFVRTVTRVQPHRLKKFLYRSWSSTFPIRPYKTHRYNHWIANADTAKMYHVCTGAAAFSYDAQKFYNRGKSIDFVKAILSRSYEENYGSGCTRWMDNQNTRCRNCFAKIIRFPSVRDIFMLRKLSCYFPWFVTSLLIVVNLLSSSMGWTIAWLLFEKFVPHLLWLLHTTDGNGTIDGFTIYLWPYAQ